MNSNNEFQKALVRGLGKTTIVVDKGGGKTVYIPESAHDASVERLFSSKRFKKAMPKGRYVVKEGQVPILAAKKFQYIKVGDKCFCQTLDGNRFWCVKLSKDTAKIIDMGKLIPMLPKNWVLVKSVFSYSFTIKTSNMTTKKAAPKKAAKGKKVVVKEGGPGKIEQIIALHKQGLSNKEIIEKGFNKTTVSIQVSKFKRAKEAAKASKKKG